MSFTPTRLLSATSLPALVTCAAVLPAVLFPVADLSAQSPEGVPAGTTITIEPDRDNSLYEDFAGSLSNGTGTRIFAALNLSGQPRRALLHFDIAGAVPPGATITDVTLELFSQMRMGGTHNLSMHSVSQDWGEGDSLASGGQGGGGVAESGDATWLNTFFPNQNWTNPGGDFNATASSSTSTTNVTADPLFPSTSQLVADAQSYLDNPGTNFGWLVKTDEVQNGNAAAYGSREATAGNRPVLTITYIGGSQAANVTYGAGCNGSGTTPLLLTANSLPQVPNPGYELQLSGGPTVIFGQFIAFSLSRSPFPLPLPFFAPGCTLDIDPGTFLGDFAPVGGVLPLPIPNLPSLVGGVVTCQGFSAEPSLLIATSNGLEIQFDL